MITAESAKLIKRGGGLLAMLGLAIGIAVFVGWRLSRGEVLLLWILPVLVGSVVALAGIALERSAIQSNVGRQMER